MKSILIIGGLGMLGSQVIKEFLKSNFKIYTTYRKKTDKITYKKKYLNQSKEIFFYKFDITKSKLRDINKLTKDKDIIINCAGTIKPYINEFDSKSIEEAIYINSIFPHKLNDSVKNKKIKIFQIATDCVFSGKKGNYTESSLHDPVDIYGKSKSLGEVKSLNFFNLRCSIIGNEIKNKKSLIEWFKSSKENSKLNGFVDHQWNGITTKAFAILLRTIIEKNISIPNNLNIIPKNKLNKYELLSLFKKCLKREDIFIKKTKSTNKVNRTLKTNYVSKNSELWKKSIYFKIPTIQKLVSEIL